MTEKIMNPTAEGVQVIPNYSEILSSTVSESYPKYARKKIIERNGKK
ncbi:hypothetical protein MKX36_13765 [Paenibacillus sp. FSL W8-0439]